MSDLYAIYYIDVTKQIPCSSYWYIDTEQETVWMWSTVTQTLHFNYTKLTQVFSLSNFLPFSRANHGHNCMPVLLRSTCAVSDNYTSCMLYSCSCRGCDLFLESLWFYQDTTIYTNNKTCSHDVTEILLGGRR